MRPLYWLMPLLFVGAVSSGACDSNSTTTTTSGNSSEATGGAGGDGAGFNLNVGGGGGATPECVNLECLQVDCGPGATTSISGTIYDPSGTLPLYNVGVYVPNSDVGPLANDLICDTCNATWTGSPLVSAITDTHGAFTIDNVPVGDNIPLVIQVGKWRRQITLPAITQCVDNALTDPQMMRLPRSSAEGNIPKIALSTGSADPLFCLFRRLGIDDSEFGITGRSARIQLFRGMTGSSSFDAGFGASPGATFPNAQTTLWDTDWVNYDIAMLSCESSEQSVSKNGLRTGLRDYINAGGRVFATHFHYNWFQGDAPADLASIATFGSNLNAFTDIVDIDQTFPKGVALAEWLEFVDGTNPLGQFNVVDGRRHTETIHPDARVWVRYENDIEYFHFNAPIGAPEEDQCGRMVFSDIHVSTGAGNPNNPFPSTCTNGPLSEQEKALIFLLFDLSSCITPDDEPICPPGQTTCGGAGDPVCAGACVNGCCQQTPQ